MPQFLDEGYKDTMKEFLVSGESDITAIYEVLPYMDGEQQQIYVKLWYFAEKYNLQPLKKALIEYKNLQLTNRPLGLTFKNLLEARSMKKTLSDNLTLSARKSNKEE